MLQTELCRSWEEFGTCRYGTKCQFAHSLDELRPVQRHPKYKTEVCRTFATTGTCPYGTRCRFIHQSAALAQLRTAKQGGGIPIETHAQKQSSIPVIVGSLDSNNQHMMKDAPRLGTVDSNPASFANVARGVAKVNRGASGHSAQGIRAPKSVQNTSSNGQSMSHLVTGVELGMPAAPMPGSYVTVAAGRSEANAANVDKKSNIHLVEKHPVEYETALTAALDVLHCNDDPLFTEVEDGQIHSHNFLGNDLGEFSVGSFSADNAMPSEMINLSNSIIPGENNSAPSGPGSPSGAIGSMPSSPHFGEMGTTVLGSFASDPHSMLSNQSLMNSNPSASSAGNSRRLPVFSNLHEK